jgi:hypothetical protein
MVLGQALMPTVPTGPREDLLGGLLPGEDQPPQPPPQLGDAQRGRRPCRALHPARGAPLLGWQQAFLSRIHRNGPRPPHDHLGIGPHGKGDMMIPAGPTAHCRVL